jgi:hypothetical protein
VPPEDPDRVVEYFLPSHCYNMGMSAPASKFDGRGQEVANQAKKTADKYFEVVTARVAVAGIVGTKLLEPPTLSAVSPPTAHITTTSTR